jgi:hypothetical protein
MSNDIYERIKKEQQSVDRKTTISIIAVFILIAAMVLLYYNNYSRTYHQKNLETTLNGEIIPQVRKLVHAWGLKKTETIGNDKYEFIGFIEINNGQYHLPHFKKSN